MNYLRKFSVDHYGGALLTLLGLGVTIGGISYRVGTLTRMGAGYIPLVLGLLMTVIGLIIALTAAPPKPDAKSLPPEWRGWLCILGGVFAFALFGTYGGMVPATFSTVFISALGDRENTLKDALLLAVGITVVGVLIFSYALNLPLPLFTWGA